MTIDIPVIATTFNGHGLLESTNERTFSFFGLGGFAAELLVGKKFFTPTLSLSEAYSSESCFPIFGVAFRTEPAGVGGFTGNAAASSPAVSKGLISVCELLK